MHIMQDQLWCMLAVYAKHPCTQIAVYAPTRQTTALLANRLFAQITSHKFAAPTAGELVSFFPAAELVFCSGGTWRCEIEPHVHAEKRNQSWSCDSHNAVHALRYLSIVSSIVCARLQLLCRTRFRVFCTTHLYSWHGVYIPQFNTVRHNGKLWNKHRCRWDCPMLFRADIHSHNQTFTIAASCSLLPASSPSRRRQAQFNKDSVLFSVHRLFLRHLCECCTVYTLLLRKLYKSMDSF